MEVVLSDEERAFLDAHVRRHKAPRSPSDRCRIILLCAEERRAIEDVTSGIAAFWNDGVLTKSERVELMPMAAQKAGFRRFADRQGGHGPDRAALRD